jgi:phosphoribosylanthranilate isomerase
MRVKICGITSYQDALSAINAGASALGFVFYEKSPRYLSPEQARKIIQKLPPFVEKVALFVNETPQFINETCHFTQATLAQIHFEADDAFYEALQVPYLKVVRAKKQKDLLMYQEEYRLVDAYSENFGGAGKQIDLSWFENIDCSKIILAGGLNPLNVAPLKKYGFYGIDVSSGVETAIKGKKDPIKIKEFIRNAR